MSQAMSSSATPPSGELRSGKGHTDENFPVASRIIHPRHRKLILAFYNFVRTADDIADHAELGAAEKIAHLDALEAGLTGQGPAQPEAVALREALAERHMPPRHALDVLTAFRMDVTKSRYQTWDELIHYCSYSAMPVGRFMLDVHGEDRATWTASDALCAALQINNHLQDCGKDFRDLDRVYIPQDTFAAHGATPADLGSTQASPALLACIRDLAQRTRGVLGKGRPLAAEISDIRLGCEVAIIQRFAESILGLLETRDPLRDDVHLSKGTMMGQAAGATATELLRRLFGGGSAARSARRA